MVDVLSPGSAAYEAVRRPAHARFHDVRPQAIARCRSERDVADALALARRSDLHVAIRSGGHCFAGRSTTDELLLDVGPMYAVAVEDGLATIGAGARLSAVYDALEPHGLAIAGGCGPTVGIAGLALGGGIGILGRRHGLTCDQLVAARVVLADGRVVDCDERRCEDLFWALRGAGGGQFGVVTSLTLRTVPAPATTTLHMEWPYRDAGAVVDAWQEWAPDAQDELAASALVTAGPDRAIEPRVHVFGAMLGTRREAAGLLDDLLDRAGASPLRTSSEEVPFRRAKHILNARAPGEAMPPDAHGFAKSEFFRGPLPREALTALLEHLAGERRAGELRVLDFSPMGGAYNRPAEGATAFAHRAERFLLKHDVVTQPANEPEARVWLARSWALVHPWGSGRVYPNFPDPDLEDAGAAYHAGNLDRLMAVKALYDPEDRFRFSQSLQPATPG